MSQPTKADLWEAFNQIEVGIEKARQRCRLREENQPLIALPERFAALTVYDDSLEKFRLQRERKMSRSIYMKGSRKEPMLWKEIKWPVRQVIKKMCSNLDPSFFSFALLDCFARQSASQTNKYAHMIVGFPLDDDSCLRSDYLLGEAVPFTGVSLDIRDKVLHPVVVTWAEHEVALQNLPPPPPSVVSVAACFPIPNGFHDQGHWPKWEGMPVPLFTVNGPGGEDELRRRLKMHLPRDEREAQDKKFAWAIAHYVHVCELTQVVASPNSLSRVTIACLPSSSRPGASTMLILTFRKPEALDGEAFERLMTLTGALGSSVGNIQYEMLQIIEARKRTAKAKWMKDAHEIHDIIPLIDSHRSGEDLKALRHYLSAVFGSRAINIPAGARNATTFEELVQEAVQLAAPLFRMLRPGFRYDLDTTTLADIPLLSNQEEKRIGVFQAVLCALYNVFTNFELGTRVAVGLQYLRRSPTLVRIENKGGNRQPRDLERVGSTKISLQYFASTFGQLQDDSKFSEVPKGSNHWVTTFPLPDGFVVPPEDAVGLKKG